MASAVVLTAGGGVVFALSGRLPEPALAWMIGGAVVALGGILLIVYYFDKWGHL